MNINRHNYEEFFLLYVDNELTAMQKKAVEEFVQENPDLEEELVMLQQSVLRPGHVVFENKPSLFKNVPAEGLVNATNYQEYFVLYGDNELTTNEKILVEQFVEKHPQLQQEFDLIQQAKLIPDSALVFPDKNDLYRTAADERVVPFPWRKLAVAAVFVLFLGGFAWFVANNKPRDPQVATTPGKSTNGIAVTDTNNKPKTNPVTPSNTQPVLVKEEKQVAPKENIENNTAQVPANKKKETIKTVEEKNKPEETFAGNNKNNSKVTSNNPAPENVPQVENNRTLTAKDVTSTFASVTRPAVNVAVSERTEKEAREDLKIQNTQVVYIDEPVDETLYADNSSGNKRPLRGFFRKVTRVFDKATNAEANESNKKNIRIAAFEIALK